MHDRPGAARRPGPSAGITARFDDLAAGGASFCLVNAVATFVANSPGDVATVLHAAEQAARDGCWVAGFVTYEAGVAFDPTLSVVPRRAGDPLADLPLAWFTAFEHRCEVAPVRRADDGEAGTWDTEMNAAEHGAAVEQIRLGIAAGAFYQVNMTTRMIGRETDIHRRYAALADGQRASFNALITTGEHAIASASPELFLERTGSTVTTRPMKGTAARGRWPAEDLARLAALTASEKERAENVMIVDLMRNDLGRVAEVGTVRVPALLQAERYPTVWQLTSTVTARARPDVGMVELFGSLFPPGSVTGAPKAAAMAAIAGLEQRPRGVYCGAVGYLAPAAPSPTLRFAVAIRTLTASLRSGHAEYGTGSGITWSSDPAAEWAELRAKTRVLCDPPTRFQALVETLRFEPPRLVNLDRHLDRLSASAHHFGIEHDRAVIAEAVAGAVARLDRSARVRITLDRSAGVCVATEPFEPFEPNAGPVELAVSAPAAVRSDDELLFHKTSARGVYERARAAHPGADDVVLVNEAGHVTETTTGNLAVRSGARWWTPTLSSGLLPGVERARLLAIGALTERVITVDELAAAEALAVVSSARGTRPARLGRASPSDSTDGGATPPVSPTLQE